MDAPTPHRRELDSYSRFIIGSLEHTVRCLDGLDERQINWRPPAEGANSLYVLAVHSFGNAEENILHLLGGQPLDRQREQEFAAEGTSAAAVYGRWQALQEQLRTAIASLSPGDLEREYEHPRRGVLTGREILLVVARHAAEHMGQAALTRDLLAGAGA